MVASQYGPCVSRISEPRLEHSDVSSVFVTDLTGQRTTWKEVVAWISGHTLDSAEFKRSGMKVMSKRRGYSLPRQVTRKPRGAIVRESTREA